jgi:2-polyprenyl-3-methyl-5-hydroxy-6-metoxy-1,4-benzoquinol methylase
MTAPVIESKQSEPVNRSNDAAITPSEQDASLRENCPVCGAKLGASSPLRRVGRYNLFECGVCEIQFWDPFKRLDASWYEHFYVGRLQNVPPLEPGHKFFLADPRAPKRGRLFDIGCGVGNFMAAARSAGLDVTGIDWDSNAATVGKEVLGLETIFPLSIEEYVKRNSGDRFDIVSFFEVLEHQDNPRGFIAQVRSLLKPGGHIAVSVPNRNRWQKGLDLTDLPPNHLTRWNPEVLTAFVRREGFEILSLREEPIGLRRTASMLSAAMPTGLGRMVMGGAPPNSTEVAENPEQALATLQKQSRSGRSRLGSLLIRCKNGVFFLPAAVCWPFLRWKGYRGVYMYCLARWNG